MHPSQDKKAVAYHNHYSDGTLFPNYIGAIHSWDIVGLDITGMQIEENGTTRTVADGPDETGMIMFEDGTEAWLRCPYFKGQDTEEGRTAIYEQDRKAREEAGLIIQVN